MDTSDSTPSTPVVPQDDIHHKIGLLTRQLHDTLRELGLAEKLQNTAEALPDAKSRLSYIARLTGEAAEKVLNRVDQAKTLNDRMTEEAKRMTALMVQDPVAAVAKGHIMNFLTDQEKDHQDLDQHMTEIMMAQDFHDLTGQVIAKVVNLASSIEEQMVQLLIQTAPPNATLPSKPVAPPPANPLEPRLDGPVVNAEGNPDVVTDQSEVDDLLASLGF
jgi:chemotaxis protein CheZ